MAVSNSNRSSIASQITEILDKITLVEGILTQSIELCVQNNRDMVHIPEDFVDSSVSALRDSRKQLLALEKQLPETQS